MVIYAVLKIPNNDDDRPYFSVFILSRPLFFVVLAWMGLAYKDKLEDD